MKTSIEKETWQALEKNNLAGKGIDGGTKITSATEAWIGSIGGVSRLVFTKGGAAQIKLTTGDIARMLEALVLMENKKKKPDVKLTSALGAAEKALYSARRKIVELNLTVPMGQVAVSLDPIIPEIGPSDHGWDKQG